MVVSISVINKTTESLDGHNTWINLTTPTSGWEIRTSRNGESLSNEVSIREDDVVLVNRDAQLEFKIGMKREITSFEDGTWRACFLPDLTNIPRDFCVEVENKSGSAEG